MSWLGGLLAGDEELGKKDDDHRPLNGAPTPSSWSARRRPAGLRKRRIFYGICAILFLYVFIKNIPTDLGPTSRYNLNQRPDDGGRLGSETADLPTRKPRKPAEPSEADEHYHNGPIKFYMLAASLHSAARLGGQHESNKNVLFAASNLKSASEIIPLACEMARWDRNDVHFAIMGRDDMEISEIKRLNGAEEDCNVHWHDARPDYSRWSSDFRMETSVTASMTHIHTFIHPQVILIDNPSREDAFFVNALRSKAMDIRKSLIELPADATENLMWITRLDSGSLAAWSTTYVDLLIQAPTGSSGSLVRLLKSIENADYFGFRRPHITIELPSEVDPPTWDYLQNLIWPPLDWSGAPHASQVTLRHRISRRTMTEYEASARIVESFYPARTKSSHVLLLSPQVELSPLYYHFVIYSLLEYKYSAHGQVAKDAPNILGFSLELPSFYLNDTTPFAPPVKKGEPTPFLWQSPNSNAALYFGDRWIEFHSFLTARLSKPPPARRKSISEKHPAWLEFLLEFMRARGYSLIYPNFASDEDSIATIHDELYQVPEEFPEKTQATDSSIPDLDPDEPLTGESDPQTRKAPPNTESALLSSDLISSLPNSGDLPELSNMPLLFYNGVNMSRELSAETATAFAQTYQREVGDCRSASEISTRQPNSALDLFCRLDIIYDPLQSARRSSNLLPSQPESMPRDEDVIQEEQHDNAKAEASAHLARQAGSAKPAQSMQEVSPPEPIQGDDNEETQREFRLQMERQAKQATGGKKEEPAKVNNRDPKQATGGKKEEPAKADNKDPKQAESKPFSKQSPKVAVEDPKAEAANEKGAGW